MGWSQTGGAQIIQGASGPMIWTGMGWAPYTGDAAQEQTDDYGNPINPSAEDSDLAQFGEAPPAQESMDDYGNPIGDSYGGMTSGTGMSGGAGPVGGTMAQMATGNSYGLQSQPTGGGYSSGPSMSMNAGLSAPASGGGAGPVNYGSTSGQMPQTARQMNDAAHQAAMADAARNPNSVAGRGGSSSIVAGPVPDVGAMAQPFMGGPPGMGSTDPVGAGAMPTTMRDIYSAFIQDPSSMNSNPMYKNMMEAGLQAAERGARSRGFSGSGNLLTELQDRGTGIAGQFLPQMANMYQGAASNEASRWGTENQGKLAGSQFGLNQWQAASNDQLNRATANYGAGQDQTAMIRNLQTQQQYQPLMQQMLLRGY